MEYCGSHAEFGQQISEIEIDAGQSADPEICLGQGAGNHDHGSPANQACVAHFSAGCPRNATSQVPVQILFFARESALRVPAASLGLCAAPKRCRISRPGNFHYHPLCGDVVNSPVRYFRVRSDAIIGSAWVEC